MFPAPRPSLTLRAGRHEVLLGPRTLVVGILNCTPDSFSDGGRYLDPSAALQRLERMVEEGADWIDVGGESTRPGAAEVPAGEEWRRVAPVFEEIRRAGLNLPVSVDTRKSDVAARAFEAGASILNDVSALRHDPAMPGLARDAGAAVILMHMQGDPATMQADPVYDDAPAEVRAFLEARARFAVEEGIPRDRLVVDPGIGFGKTTAHNAELLRRLPDLAASGFPILIGASRKRFLGILSDTPRVEDRLEASVAAHVAAALAGAHLVRVHDVLSTIRALRIADALRGHSTGAKGVAA